MIITSKFDGKCKKCGATILAGTKIEWTRESGATCANGCKNVQTQSAARAGVTQEGIYKRGETIYRVKFNQSKTALYAERLHIITGNRLNGELEVVKWDYEYERGAVYSLDADMKMNAQEAKELAIQYGYCVWCGTKLKDAKSVANGIGPVCAKRFK